MNNQIQLKTVSMAAALLAAVMAVLGLGLTALPASAANLDDAKITLSTESVVTNQWDQVDLTCQWSVPDYSQPGDSFSVQLPSELRWFGEASFDLDNADGERVATAVANDAGLVVFTLSEFVELHPVNVGGTCSFSTQYALEPEAGETEQLTFTVGSSVVRVPVVIEPCEADCGPGVPTSAGKSMRWVDPAQTELESIFSMPPMPSDTNDVIVTDTPAAGMEIACDWITPRVGQMVSNAGNVVEPYDNERYPAAIECSPQKATVTWTGLPKGEHVELFVVTTVTDASLALYENTGTVTIAGLETPVGAQLRRTEAGGSGDGSAPPTPSPTTTTTTPTPSPTPTTTTTTPSASPTPTTTTTTPSASPTATPTRAAPAPTLTPTSGPSTGPSTAGVVVAVPANGPSEPAQSDSPGQLDNTGQLANTGAQGSLFIFLAAALLAAGSLLAVAGVRRSARRVH